MFSTGFIYRWGVRIKEFGERLGHIRIFGKVVFSGLANLMVNKGLKIRASAMRNRI